MDAIPGFFDKFLTEFLLQLIRLPLPIDIEIRIIQDNGGNAFFIRDYPCFYHLGHQAFYENSVLFGLLLVADSLLPVALGLFLVVNVLRKLGGDISAENRPQGARVTLSLPLAALTDGDEHDT